MFRESVVSLLSILYPVGFLGFLGLVILDEGFRFNRFAISFGLLVGFPVALAASWIISKCFADIVSADGIHGHSFWGLRRSVRWQDIKEVRPFRLLHLKWLRLYSKQDQTGTWIGLHQARREEFRSAIQRLAPSDNPILRYIS